MSASVSSQVIQWARTVWDYHCLRQPLEKCECLLVLGSHDTRVAEHAADLFLAGWAPMLVFSGGLGNLTRGVFDRPEAELFADIAVGRGVPEERILIENRSTNTGENVRFTRQLLASKGWDPSSFLLVQKPYMERRALATFQAQWPGKKAVVSSPPLDFLDYPNEEIPLEKVIHILVGDLQRLRLYPEKGFSVPQEMPDAVWAAYENLVAAGFTGHLVK